MTRCAFVSAALMVACGGPNNVVADASVADSTVMDVAADIAFLDAYADTSIQDASVDGEQSCSPGGFGMTNCGAGNESCCTSLAIEGGTFYRTYATDGGSPTDEADPATVSPLRLDAYEVTVGRFREFVAAWNNGNGWLPLAGSGKHEYLNTGNGVANATSLGTFESGWSSSDNSNVHPTTLALTDFWTCGPYGTWTDTPSKNENLPISCVNWYEATAFCIWDGGFLPTEAEWELAAAGGSEQRQYPWGSATPGTACPGTGCSFAIWGCYYPSGPADGGTGCQGWLNIAPVGFASQGFAKWGQLDLAGSMSEWTLDGYATAYADPCTDCADLTNVSTRVIRGGNFNFGSLPSLSPPYRFDEDPTQRLGSLGFRCARPP